MSANINVRDLLVAIGVGHFNATTMVAQTMISPATSDPKSAQTHLLVEHIQKALYGLGAASVPISGRLDANTVQALNYVVGDGWIGKPWYATIQAIVSAQQSGMTIKMPAPAPATDDSAQIAVGGPLDFLPDVPGGLFTYAVAGYFLYRHFSKRRAS